MPTSKPIIQTVVNEETYKKFEILAQNERRSHSNMAATIIEAFIKSYESKHGEISLQQLKE